MPQAGESSLIREVLSSHAATEVLKGEIVVEQGQYLSPCQRKFLHKSLQTEIREEYRRRIEIMLLADRGQSQAQICKAVGCSSETARYWVTMAQSGQAHNWDTQPMGRPKTVNEKYLERLKELVSNNPRKYGYPFQSWTAKWLGKHLAKELDIEVSDCHISRLLKQMGLSTRSTTGSDTMLEDSTDRNRH